MEPMLKVIATLCAALFTGGALYVSLVEHPVRMADMAIALREFRHSYRRAAPWHVSAASFLSANGMDPCAGLCSNIVAT
jgi:hypothetical protein